MEKLRTGIATSEGMYDKLIESGTPLSYGATAESWRDALTTMSGDNPDIGPREVPGVTGWSSINNTVSTAVNEGNGGEERMLCVQWHFDFGHGVADLPESVDICLYQDKEHPEEVTSTYTLTASDYSEYWSGDGPDPSGVSWIKNFNYQETDYFKVEVGSESNPLPLPWNFVEEYWFDNINPDYPSNVCIIMVNDGLEEVESGQ